MRDFPSALRDQVDVVAGIMPEPERVIGARAQRVSVQGEDVEIPDRIYSPELSSDVVRSLSEIQRLIAACVYSRHHDGYVRQSSCAAIVASAEPWVVPYIVQLLGEYVVEISTLILERLTAQSSFSAPAYRQFVDANSAFIELTQQRAISYWDCYYRRDFARDDYPAIVALDLLRQGHGQSDLLLPPASDSRRAPAQLLDVDACAPREEERSHNLRVMRGQDGQAEFARSQGRHRPSLSVSPRQTRPDSLPDRAAAPAYLDPYMLGWEEPCARRRAHSDGARRGVSRSLGPTSVTGGSEVTTRLDVNSAKGRMDPLAAMLQRAVSDRTSEAEMSRTVRPMLQRRVLTIGEVDAEVEVSQEYLARSIEPLFPQSIMGSFENTQKLSHQEREVLVGHGNQEAIASMSAPAFAAELAKRLDRGRHYELVLFACNVGKAPAPLDSLAHSAVKLLADGGYKVDVIAPEALAFVVAPGLAVTGSPYTKEVGTTAQREGARMYVRAFEEITGGINKALEGPLDATWQKEILADLQTLKGKNVKAAKQALKGELPPAHLRRALAALTADQNTRKIDAILNTLGWVTQLRTYELLGEDRFSIGELTAILDKRYRREFLNPGAASAIEANTTPAKALRGLPRPGTPGWQTTLTLT